MADIERIRRLRTLTEDMGVNLAGAEVALKLMARIEELEVEVADPNRHGENPDGNRRIGR